MSEARINIATGFNGGVSVSLRADSKEELQRLVEECRQASANDAALANAFAPLLAGQSVEQATSVVQAAFPQAAPAAAPPWNTSTVGQPLPQPGAQAPAAAPPTLNHPGNCAHGGPYVYVDKPARGKPWRRWECSVPWSKDAVGRCRPVNVD